MQDNKRWIDWEEQVDAWGGYQDLEHSRYREAIISHPLPDNTAILLYLYHVQLASVNTQSLDGRWSGKLNAFYSQTVEWKDSAKKQERGGDTREQQ